MRRRAGLAIVLTMASALLALGVGSLGGAYAGPATAQTSGSTATRSGGEQLVVTRSAKGVQPGIGGERITARVSRSAQGRVRFVLSGAGIRQRTSILPARGRAVFRVPPLATGRYVVTASFAHRSGTATFQVFDSDITLNRVSLTVSRSSSGGTAGSRLAGFVRYNGRRAPGGYLDLYKNGRMAKGEKSEDYLGYATINGSGRFSYAAFGADVAAKYAPGVYVFRGFYTPTPEFADYVTSDLVTVTVVR